MKPDARTHRMENASVYCRYCGAHPNNWQREQCEHREPDASTAREHAETVRSLLDEICTDSLECKVEHLLRDRVHSESQEVSALFVAMHDALAALFATVKRLERERDRAEERVREAAKLFGVCDGGRYWNDWKESHRILVGRAEATEARAQRYREALWSIASGAWMEDAPRHKYSGRVFARRALSADPLVCRDPNLCWGTGTCPRDPACNE